VSEQVSLFDPIQVGTLTVPNRVVMTAVKLGYGTTAGEVTERHIAFYRRRAEGDLGLIITEPMYIQLNGRELPTQLGIHTDDLLPGLTQMTAAVHEAGGRIVAHINHAGRAANPKLVQPEALVSASDVFCPAAGTTPRPLTKAEIDETVAAFAAAARRARQAGFDAVEIPFSHGYLIHQFLSPRSNRRDDEYGGSFENRMRFGREVIAAVRRQVGNDYPIIARINAADYAEGGMEIEDAIQAAQALEGMGVNALSVTSGTMCESVPFCLYPTGTPKANLLPMAARIRTAVSLPVIVAGRVRTPTVAKEALAAGQADMIGLGRPLLSDPDWVKKTQAEDDAAIMLCAACHQGCLAELRVARGTGCVFNPLTGREATVQVNPATAPRQVLVVGGGPAGLEAATVAAERGHHVTLLEQEDFLGGQFVLAAKAPHKEEFNDIITTMALRARRAGVDIRTGVHVRPDMIVEEGPDAVVLATGAVPLSIPFPGLEETNWCMASDILDEDIAVTTDTALVIGGGLVGLETADFLAARGKKVTVVEMLDDVGGDMDILAKMMLRKRLDHNQVQLLPQTKVQKLTKDTVTAVRAGEETTLPIEMVIIAVGMRSNRGLSEALAQSGLETYTIGDAVRPRKALEAIWEGFEVGNRL
jgi:2,4-dienoyl-CoA reductase-like NADH-dependent reductase (Old Yellow Enzyme family)/thioredoxin reductase